MQTINATEVRNNFSFYIDTVIREKPIAVKRNRDVLLFFSDQIVKDLVKDLAFQAELTHEDETIVGTIEGFDLVVEGKSEKKLSGNLLRIYWNMLKIMLMILNYFIMLLTEKATILMF